MAAKKKVAKKKAPSKKRTKTKAQKKLENIVVWFEIPVTDLNRAMKFYSSVLAIKLEATEMGESRGAMFPFKDGIASGALIQSKENAPCSTGTMIYLNGGKNLAFPLKRAVSAGGKIIQDKMNIGMGFIAIFEDTEGNHVALHSEF